MAIQERKDQAAFYLAAEIVKAQDQLCQNLDSFYEKFYGIKKKAMVLTSVLLILVGFIYQLRQNLASPDQETIPAALVIPPIKSVDGVPIADTLLIFQTHKNLNHDKHSP